MKIRALCSFGISAVFVALCTNHSLAQQDTSTALPLVLRRAQAANQMVRLRSTAQAQSVGRITSLTDTTVRIGRQTIRLSDQDHLEVRFTRADPLWNGAAVGALVNVAVSYPLVSALAEGMGEHELSGGEKVSILFGTALFGLLVGGAIDAARAGRPEWRSVWSRREP